MSNEELPADAVTERKRHQLVSGDEQPKRQFDGIKHPKKTGFLDAFSKLGQIGKACEVAMISRGTHYFWMKKDEKYLKAFHEAEQMAADYLIDVLHERATVGAEHVISYEGQITDRYKIPSDLCLIFALKRLRPEFRDNFLVNNFNGPTQLNVNHSTTTIDPLAQKDSFAQDQAEAWDEGRRIGERSNDDD
jgi:hypothetical protein